MVRGGEGDRVMSENLSSAAGAPRSSSPAAAGGGTIIRDGFRLEARPNDGLVGDLPLESTPQGYRLSVPEGRKVLVIETYQTRKPEPYTTQTHIQLSIAPGARVTHYKLVLEGHQAAHESFLEVETGKGAAFYSHVFLMGGAKIRNTIQVRLAGENAECVLNGLYVGRGQQVIETHTLIEHQ